VKRSRKPLANWPTEQIAGSNTMDTMLEEPTTGQKSPRRPARSYTSISTDPSRPERYRAQHATAQWMKQFDRFLTHACTFTFHQEAGGVALTPERIWKYWGNYCKLLNRKLYGHAAKRHNRTLLILPALHGASGTTRLHMHAAIGCVDGDFNFEELKAMICDSWRTIRWAQPDIKIDPYRDSGWIDYMLREHKSVNAPCAHLTHCCVPPFLNH
jgi:hypothetical protein